MPRMLSRRTRPILAAVTGLSIGAALWLGASSLSAAGPEQPSTLELTATTGDFAVVQHGRPGPALSLGDMIVSHDVLSRSGTDVGRAGVTCDVVRVTPSSLTCLWTWDLLLPAGQLVLQGITDGPAGPPKEPLAFTLAVTGGTGDYENARGAADIVDHPGGTEEITVRLDG